MQIFVQKDGQQLGPYTLDLVNGYLAQGSLLGSDPAWHNELVDWIPLNQVAGVRDPKLPAPPAFDPTTYNPDTALPPVVAPPEVVSPSPREIPLSADTAKCSGCQNPVQNEASFCGVCGQNLQIRELDKSAHRTPPVIGLSSGQDVMSSSHDITSVQNCPNGHGPLRDWEGSKRCWDCGWPYDKQTIKSQKNTGNPNSKWAVGDVIFAVLIVVGIVGTLVAIYHLTSTQNVGVSLWNIFAVITWSALYFRVASWIAEKFPKKG